MSKSTWILRKKVATIFVAAAVTIFSLCFGIPAEGGSSGTTLELTVNVSPVGAGSVIVNGSPAPSYPYTYRFAEATTVSVEAAGAYGHAFEYWGGCISGSANPTVITVTQSRTVTAHFTSVPTEAAIGGFVWDDADADGIQDYDESGLQDESIFLLLDSGILIDSTTTARGDFLFTDLDPGEYRIFLPPQRNMVFSPKQHGDDERVDSDITAGGLSDVIALGVQEARLYIGAGVYRHTSQHIDLWPRQAEWLVDNALIIDVREPGEYCGAGGIIHCAVNVPWFSGDFEESMSVIPRDMPLLVVCASGHRSREAAEHLSAMGFSAVFNMRGGMLRWQGITYSCAEPCP